jgi:hypothetical protein
MIVEGFAMRFAKWIFAVSGLTLLSLSPLANADAGGLIIVAQQEGAEAKPTTEDSLEARWARRFPQKVKVGHLVGLPMLDDDDVTLGHVQQIVRSPEGKIKLIVGYSRWFGWFGRPVAVPIEAVAILARQIASIEMPPAEYQKAPTWMAGADRPIPGDEIIRIAVTRR